MTVRWPWVSRELLDEVRGERDRLVKDNAELRDLLMRMKLAGGSLVLLRDGAGAPARGKAPARELTVFERIVAQDPRAKADPRLAAHLLRWADDQMRNVPPDQWDERHAQVEAQLRSWRDAKEDDDDDDDEHGDQMVRIA